MYSVYLHHCLLLYKWKNPYALYVLCGLTSRGQHPNITPIRLTVWLGFLSVRDEWRVEVLLVEVDTLGIKVSRITHINDNHKTVKLLPILHYILTFKQLVKVVFIYYWSV